MLSVKIDRRNFLQLVGIGTVALPWIVHAATGSEERDESITLPVLVYPSQNLPGEWLAYSPGYKLMGQGGSYKEAKESIESVIINYLDVFSRSRIALPLPETSRPDEGFKDFINKYREDFLSTEWTKDETKPVRFSGMPELVFEYFKVKC